MRQWMDTSSTTSPHCPHIHVMNTCSTRYAVMLLQLLFTELGQEETTWLSLELENSWARNCFMVDTIQSTNYLKCMMNSSTDQWQRKNQQLLNAHYSIIVNDNLSSREGYDYKLETANRSVKSHLPRASVPTEKGWLAAYRNDKTVERYEKSWTTSQDWLQKWQNHKNGLLMCLLQYIDGVLSWGGLLIAPTIIDPTTIVPTIIAPTIIALTTIVQPIIALTPKMISSIFNRPKCRPMRLNITIFRKKPSKWRH